MKIHTNNFKNQIKELGRELDSKITYNLNGTDYILSSEDINHVTIVINGGILKSVMKELDVDSNLDIPIGTILNYKFGVKVDNEYEYLNFGNYVVYSSSKNEDTNSYNLVCYDKMLYTMKQNEDLNITYPTTITNYINSLCNKLGLTFANNNEQFANYNRVIEKELYVGLDYTYRDILDELAQVTASTICINTNDELEIRYINNTNDTIDEEYFKDVNVRLGQKYGPINSVVLSRSTGSDNVYLSDEDSIEANGLCEVKIVDNQIMNWNNRSDYLPDILEKLNGLEYYINDFASKGICYYDLCDKYNVKIGENTYNCILFNNEINITQGLEENIYTDMPEEAKTDYSKSDKTDRRINQAYLIVDKQNQIITSTVSKVTETENTVDDLSTNMNDLKGSMNTVKEAVETLKSTMMTQTEESFEMLFQKTGIGKLVEDMDETLKGNTEKLDSISEYIKFEGAKITLGKSTSQSKLVIENDIIKFMTGESMSAYISENQLYITDSTILNKLQIGHWETKEDSANNLNTRWVGGN